MLSKRLFRVGGLPLLQAVTLNFKRFLRPKQRLVHELAGGALHLQELEDLARQALVHVLLARFNVAVQLLKAMQTALLVPCQALMRARKQSQFPHEPSQAECLKS